MSEIFGKCIWEVWASGEWIRTIGGSDQIWCYDADVPSADDEHVGCGNWGVLYCWPSSDAYTVDMYCRYWRCHRGSDFTWKMAISSMYENVSSTHDFCMVLSPHRGWTWGLNSFGSLKLSSMESVMRLGGGWTIPWFYICNSFLNFVHFMNVIIMLCVAVFYNHIM
jgi:hypothetical protein